MALPMNSMPTFTLTIPSTNQKVRYRPFLVKDEKALMIAQQSEDLIVMADTLKNVIASCVIDKVDVESLATFDIEYIFTQIRAKSVGETIELIMSCDDDHGEELNKKASQKITVDLINDIEIKRNPDHNKKIELFGDVGVVMRYPTFVQTKEIFGSETNDGDIKIDKVFDVIAECIDFIYQGDDIYYAKEQKKEELITFLENLTTEQFLKVQKFFDTMPRISTTIRHTCPVCNKQYERVLEGLNGFF